MNRGSLLRGTAMLMASTALPFGQPAAEEPVFIGMDFGAGPSRSTVAIIGKGIKFFIGDGEDPETWKEVAEVKSLSFRDDYLVRDWPEFEFAE